MIVLRMQWLRLTSVRPAFVKYKMMMRSIASLKLSSFNGTAMLHYFSPQHFTRLKVSKAFPGMDIISTKPINFNTMKLLLLFITLISTIHTTAGTAICAY